jgi:hypothetical protein
VLVQFLPHLLFLTFLIHPLAHASIHLSLALIRTETEPFGSTPYILKPQRRFLNRLRNYCMKWPSSSRTRAARHPHPRTVFWLEQPGLHPLTAACFTRLIIPLRRLSNLYMYIISLSIDANNNQIKSNQCEARQRVIHLLAARPAQGTCAVHANCPLTSNTTSSTTSSRL